MHAEIDKYLGSSLIKIHSGDHLTVKWLFHCKYFMWYFQSLELNTSLNLKIFLLHFSKTLDCDSLSPRYDEFNLKMQNLKDTATEHTGARQVAYQAAGVIKVDKHTETQPKP